MIMAVSSSSCHEGEVMGSVNPTQVQGALEQGASRLLGVEGLAVARVDLEEDGSRVAHVVTDDESAAACRRVGCSPPRSRGTRSRGRGRAPTVRASRLPCWVKCDEATGAKCNKRDTETPGRSPHAAPWRSSIP